MKDYVFDKKLLSIDLNLSVNFVKHGICLASNQNREAVCEFIYSKCSDWCF